MGQESQGPIRAPAHAPGTAGTHPVLRATLHLLAAALPVNGGLGGAPSSALEWSRVRGRGCGARAAARPPARRAPRRGRACGLTALGWEPSSRRPPGEHPGRQGARPAQLARPGASCPGPAPAAPTAARVLGTASRPAAAATRGHLPQGPRAPPPPEPPSTTARPLGLSLAESHSADQETGLVTKLVNGGRGRASDSDCFAPQPLIATLNRVKVPRGQERDIGHRRDQAAHGGGFPDTGLPTPRSPAWLCVSPSGSLQPTRSL